MLAMRVYYLICTLISNNNNNNYNSILAGPAFEYKEYVDTVTGDAYKQRSYSEVVTSAVDTASSDNTNGHSSTVKLSPSNRTLPVITKLVTGLVCAVIHQVNQLTLLL
jgi:hypothetical protein